MPNSSPRLLVLGAHPDDAEFHCGGLISSYRQQGHDVKIVSVTNGAAGHHELASDALAQVRRQEADAVARRIGVAYEVWDYPDGELQPTLEVRRRIIHQLRSFVPDLVLTHRTNDYHPDHRAVGQLVQDASFTVTVPLIVPETPALRVDPVVAFMADFFTKPNPLAGDVVLDVSPHFETVIDLLHCHASQVYEWLPYNLQLAESIPVEAGQRKRWLADWYALRARAVADRFRTELIETYGDERGRTIEFAEAYEVSEYAGELTDDQRPRLFPGTQ